MSDYCTGWWDGWPSWLGGTGQEWMACCKAHDLAYSAGFWSSVRGDFDLARCVTTEGGSAMAAIMLAGVATFGTLLKIHYANRTKTGGEDRSK
jgi:hypothetical protein